MNWRRIQLEREEEALLLKLRGEPVAALEAPGGSANPTGIDGCWRVGALVLRGAISVLITGEAVDIVDDEVFRIAVVASEPHRDRDRPRFAELQWGRPDAVQGALVGELLVPLVISTTVGYGPRERALNAAVDTGILLESANGARLLVETPNAELGNLPPTIAPLDLLLTANEALIQTRLNRADTQLRACFSMG